MMITLAVLGLALGGFVLVVITLARRGPQVSTLEEWESRRHEISFEAFRSLLDPEEEQFLRRTLPSPAFRRLQRKRLALAMKYVRRINENAGMLMQLAGAAKDTAQFPEAWDELIAKAIAIRLKAGTAQLLLATKWLFPNANVRLNGRMPRYEDMAAMLVGLKREAHIINTA